ncbi:MAG: DUF4123 domain-containing protein [Myxococcota bacterium]|nr:DUF4123 domain-containing protein [Myxococcota bacterium]
MSGFSTTRLEEQLFYPYEPSGTSLFVVLDGARDRAIGRALSVHTVEYESLFSGPIGWSLRAASPLIARLVPGEDFTRQLIAEGWGRAWGIYLASSSTLLGVRRHLRTLLRVRMDTGQKCYFRYYDPRVLRAFLPTSTPEQLRQIFGPITRFDLEDSERSRLLRFRLGPAPSSALRVFRHELGETAAPVARDVWTST